MIRLFAELSGHYLFTARFFAAALGCVWERSRASVREKGCSAKATEAEAGQRPVPPRATPAQRPSSLHSQSISDGLISFPDTPYASFTNQRNSARPP